MADNDGLWSAIGEGFRGMGAVANPRVAQNQAQERADVLPNMMRALQIKGAQRAFDADTKFSEAVGGLQPSSLKTSGDMMDALKNVPLDVIAESPRAQATLKMVGAMQQRESAAEAKKQQITMAYDRLDQQAEIARQRSEDTKLGIQERAAADKRHQDLTRELAKIREQASRDNIDLRREIAGLPPKGEGGKPAEDTPPAAGIEAATHDYLIKNAHPPVRGGVYQAVMRNVERIAKDNNMTTQQLIAASADVKTRLMAKKTFETRVQNLGRAENQLELEIPVMEDAMKNLDLPSIPAGARGKIFVLRQMGNPDVVKLDQAAETVFREFEGIVTGNPGTLNVQDVVNAHNDYRAAQTPQTMRAAIQGMRRIISNAKLANDKTRKEIMGGIDDALKGKEGGDAGKDPSAQPRTGGAVMRFDAQGNLVQ